eukprot:3160563-Rhodomonas_salina.1
MAVTCRPPSTAPAHVTAQGRGSTDWVWSRVVTWERESEEEKKGKEKGGGGIKKEKKGGVKRRKLAYRCILAALSMLAPGTSEPYLSTGLRILHPEHHTRIRSTTCGFSTAYSYHHTLAQYRRKSANTDRDRDRDTWRDTHRKRDRQR